MPLTPALSPPMRGEGARTTAGAYVPRPACGERVARASARGRVRGRLSRLPLSAKAAIVLRMDARRGPFDDFAIATAVLTRLPMDQAVPMDGAVAPAGWAFPLV